MVDFAAAVVTTIVITIVFAYFIVQLDIKEIKSDWANRRCDLAVMVAGAACKPDADPRTGFQFATDNFKYCSGELAAGALRQAFAPLYSLAGQQFTAIKTMAGPLNTLRAIIKHALDTFESFLSSMLNRFGIASWLLQKTNMHFQNAFGRIQAIFYSIIYLGLSVTTLISNQMDFTVVSLKIFLGVLAGLAIVMFIPLLPFIVMISMTIDTLEKAGYGDGLGPARAAFCVDPDTVVYMADGTLKPLYRIRCGDNLKSQNGKENRVTGVLEAESPDTSLVSIEGIRMSGSHRILWRGEWILANEHPLAIISDDKIPRVICLNTTQHEVPVQNILDRVLYVGDWEEVSTEEGRQAWINLVSDTLQAERPPTQFPKSVPLLGPGVQVYLRGDSIPVPISEVRIGDYVLSGTGSWTRVIGLYSGQIKTICGAQTPDWMSDGVWMKNVRGSWALRSGGEKHEHGGYETLEGCQLITEAEMFEVLHQGLSVIVRDFTELGASRLDSSYEMLDYYINKK
jgi:hypothetical protein